MDKNVSYKPFGNQAILIEWQSKIDVSILESILLFKQKIVSQKELFFSDVIVGYNSLTIKYKLPFNDFSSEVEKLKSIFKLDTEIKKEQRFIWEIPVCYDLEFGIDLEEIAQKSRLKVDEIIKLHSEQIYTVFFIGFLPGFLYLGGLNEQLFFDRKPNPRLNVAKGSVAIGGKQTGVYPSNSAGGWNIIGKTPINFFDVNNDNPCFAKAGDLIKFKPISLKEFYKIEKEIAANQYQLLKTNIDA